MFRIVLHRAGRDFVVVRGIADLRDAMDSMEELEDMMSLDADDLRVEKED
jgi:hypothetical protein